MPETTYPYKRPGVYVRETLAPLPQPTVPPGRAVAAFVGTHSTGPSVPTLVNSWEEFTAQYGGFGNGLHYLPFQVYAYFNNGGQRAWILRAVSSDAAAASYTVKNVPTEEAGHIVASPTGTATTGAGTKPTPKAANVQLTAVVAPVTRNPEPNALEIEWDAITPLANVDAYEVVLTDPADGTVTQTKWVTQPSSGKPKAAFTNLSASTLFSIQITPYKGATAGDPMTSPATFTTAALNTPQDALKISAQGKGVYGNSYFVSTAPSWTAGRFHVFVKYGSTLLTSTLLESWQDVSLNPGDARYVVSLVNAKSSGSAHIQVANLLPPGTPATGTGTTPDDSWYPVTVTDAPLTGGTDGVAAINLAEALAAGFSTISDVLLVNLTGNTTMTDHIPASSQITAAMAWAEARNSAFLVIDAPRQPAPIATATATTKYVEVVSSYSPKSSFAAFYGPWVSVSDPAGSSVSATRLLPPAGAVMGRFARADAEVGPNRSPAGVAYPVVSAVDVEHIFTNDQLDTLNDAGVNVIRPISQVGYCIMGARTLRQGMPDRYIAIRRMLTYIENLIDAATKFAIFEPNGPDLWAEISSVVTRQLLMMMQAQQLMSRVPEEAFFVTCNETNNTPITVANGEIHIRIGVALSSPAEFVVIEISHHQGGVSPETVTPR